MKALRIIGVFTLALTTNVILGQSDSIYVISGDSVVFAYPIQKTDSVIFYRPTKKNTTGTVANIGDFRDGGVVFWVDPTDNTKGLVVDLNDLGAAIWCANPTEISGADGVAIGTGMQNTADILVGCSELGTASDLCSKSTSGGYSDWFLPSKDELNEIYSNKAMIENALASNGGFGFASNHYWSSSEDNFTSAWKQSFVNGDQVANWKGASSFVNKVRSIRAF